MIEAEEAMQEFDSPAQAMASYKALQRACEIFMADLERYNLSSLRTWTFAGTADMRAALSAIKHAK